MQEIKYISCIYHTIFFSVPKEVRLNSTHNLIMKICNKRELRNIAVNHLEDIDDKDLMKTYKKGTSEQYSFSEH